jgi:hypothetical protein
MLLVCHAGTCIIKPLYLEAHGLQSPAVPHTERRQTLCHNSYGTAQSTGHMFARRSARQRRDRP